MSSAADRYNEILEGLSEQLPEIQGFDWAIPLPQFKALCEVAGFNVSGRIVTAYCTREAFGRVVGLDQEARDICDQTFGKEVLV